MTPDDALRQLPKSPTLCDVIQGRRTIGAFRSDPVPRDVVDRALELARWAPNHKKTEPWRAYHFGPETAQAVVELNASLIEVKDGPQKADAKRKAWAAVPGWLLVTCVRNDDASRHEEDYAACCCFVHNFTLALWEAGIGSKWSTGEVTRDAAFFELLSIDPARERVVGLIWYGYPAVVPEQTRKPVDSFLTLLP